MPRVSAYPMVQVGEALETILAHAEPLGRETVELTRARGRFLAEDVTADADLPGLPRSSCWRPSAASTCPSTDGRAWRCWPPATSWSSRTRRRRRGWCATAIATR